MTPHACPAPRPNGQRPPRPVALARARTATPPAAPPPWAFGVPHAPDASAEARPDRSTAQPGPGGHPSFARWLARRPEPLFCWCLRQLAGEAPARADFSAQAVDLLRRQGPEALADWLLWSAVMLARRACERPGGLDLSPLPPVLARVLSLAASGRVTSGQLRDWQALPVGRLCSRLQTSPGDAVATDAG